MPLSEVGVDWHVQYRLQDGRVHYHEVVAGQTRWSLREPSTNRLMSFRGVSQRTGYPLPVAEEAADWLVEGHQWSSRSIPGLEPLVAQWETLALMPGVDVSWRSEFRGWPFGSLGMVYRVKDGQPRSVKTVAQDAEPVDVVFGMPHVQRVLNMAGRLPVVELMSENASLEGNVDAAMLIAGLLDAPEWRELSRIPTEVADDWLTFCAAVGTPLKAEH